MYHSTRRLIRKRRRFGIVDLMCMMALVSMVCTTLFSQSGIVLLTSLIGILALTVLSCVRWRARPGTCGAIIGFCGPAWLALILIGELLVPPEAGVYRETDMNIPLALFLVCFVGSFTAACGAAIGTLIDIFFEIASEE